MQPKRILFLVSLPETLDFKKYSRQVEECTQKLDSLGVTVSSVIDRAVLSTAEEYDVVIVMAHLDEDTNELVLAGGRMDIPSFVESLPTGFKGIIDFSSCYSAQWISGIKERCPDCHVLGALNQTTLPFRLFIYPHVVQLYLSEEGMSYKDAYIAVQNLVKEQLSVKPSEPEPAPMEWEEPEPVPMGDADAEYAEAPAAEPEAVKLGKKMSSIYAPSKVVREEPFMIQLFLHEDSESSRKITLQAKRFDPVTRLVESRELPVNLRRGDKVTVQLSVFPADAKGIGMDKPVKELVWTGQTVKCQFNLVVRKAFAHDSFTGTLALEVNHEPVGESSFRIQVSRQKDDAPAEMSLRPRDFDADREQGRVRLKEQLETNLHRLEGQLNDPLSGGEELQKTIETCRFCLHLVENPFPSGEPARPRRVFISSTCEEFMRPFRNAVREVILELKMEPEMCDEWPQTGCNPTHVCCRKVLDSDIYVGVFGGRYGYVEPSLESSMTQVEYMTALSARKTMLLFIVNPLNRTDEPESQRLRQEHFIDYLKRSRILRTFSTVSDLSELTRNDLLDCIARR